MKLLKINGLLLIVVVGFVLRLWGINFGLPYQFHQDEPIVINHAFAYGSGDLNPHFFIIPPFCSYLLFIFYALFFIIGKIFNVFSGTEDFALKFFTDPTSFYLIARVVLGLIPGTLTIILTYLLYRRLFGKEGALFAAIAVAGSFIFVVNAHYAYVDNWLVAFILLTYILLYKAILSRSLKNIIFAAIFLGLAGSTKYNAAFLIFSFLMACVIISNHGRKVRWADLARFLFLVGCISAIVFMITNPFSVIDWKFFTTSVQKKIRLEYVGWLHHLVYSLREGMGLGLVLAGGLGFLAIVLKEKASKSVLFISFPLIFYLQLAIRSQKFFRYVLPLAPFIAMAAAFLIFQILLPKAKSTFKRGIVLFFAFLIVAPPLIKTLKADMLFKAEDTRAQAKEFIEKNIPVYTKLAVDHTFFRPPLLQTREQVIDKYALTDLQSGLKDLKEKKITFLLKSIEGKKTFNLYFLKKGSVKKGMFLSMSPAIDYDLDLLERAGISLVVVNLNTANNDFILSLKEKADLVAEFSPYYDGKIRSSYDLTDLTALPVGSKELFSRRLNGPALQIYRIREKQA